MKASLKGRLFEGSLEAGFPQAQGSLQANLPTSPEAGSPEGHFGRFGNRKA
jgi:hypothetical protein